MLCRFRDIQCRTVATLKSRSRVNHSHWKSYHQVDWVPDMHYFWDIRLEKGRVRGQPRSLRMSPFDRAHSFHSNRGSISYRFRDRRPFQSQNCKIFPLLYFASPLKGFALELGTGAGGPKTRMMYDVWGQGMSICDSPLFRVIGLL